VANQSVPETLQDLKELLVAYAKQETLDPLRNMGRFLAYGFGAVTLFIIGTLFLSMSLLRALQTLTGDVFVGFWSWVPYLIVLLALVAVAGITLSRIGKGDLGTPVDTAHRGTP
jgi:choline-glycine betaine transporter